MSPKLFLSLGAQKTGTAWLFDFFKRHPNCAAPPLKELHFFNSGVNGTMKKRLEHSKRRLQETSAKLNDDQGKRRSQFLESASVLEQNPERSAADFEQLMLSLAGPDTKFVGEFTPANGIIKRVRLEAIAQLSCRPKFLLLLRDPIDRMWSQLRMMAAKRADSPQEAKKIAEDLLDDFVSERSHSIAQRYRYDAMLRRITNVIPADQRHLRYYEGFYTPRGIEEFCHFLDIPPLLDQLDKRPHLGAAIPLSETNRRRLFEKLHPQYLAAERHLGPLPARWRAQMAH